MDISYIVMLIIIAVSVIFAFKVISKIIKFLFVGVVIVAIIMSVFLFFIKTDISELKDSVDQDRLFILHDDIKVHAVFSTQFTERDYSEDRGLVKSIILWNPTDFTNDTIRILNPAEFSDDFLKGNMQMIKDGFYTVYSVHTDTFAMGDEDIPDEVIPAANYFADAISNGLSEDEYFLYLNYQRGDINAFPKTMVFKAIDKLPGLLAKKLIGI